MPISAYRCTKIVDTYKSYWYFFGYKKHTMLGTETKGVTTQECRQWAELGHVAGMGKLKTVEANVRRTNNPIRIEYKYLQVFHGKIQNALLQKINITVDLTTGKVTDKEGGCDKRAVETKQCQSDHSTLIWDHPETKICKDVRDTKLGKTTRVKILHDAKGRKTLKAEGLKLYFTERTKTPQHIKACRFKGEMISTINGLQVVIGNCSTKGAKKAIKAGMQVGRPSMEAGKDYRYITHYMDFMENSLVNLIWENLQHEEFWECQERRKQLEILKAVAKLDPTTAVRAMTRSNIHAIWDKGSIKEIACRNVTAILQTSMKLPGGLIAGTPIATITVNNKTTKVQLKNDFWWEKKISFSKDSNNTGKQIFKINGEWREYMNGDLQSKRIKPTMLTNSIDHFKMDYKASDFAESAELEGKIQQDVDETRHWEEIGAIIRGRSYIQGASYDTESDGLTEWIDEREVAITTTPWLIGVVISMLRSMGGTGIIFIGIGLWWIIRKKRKNKSPEKRYQTKTVRNGNMQQFYIPQIVSLKGPKTYEEQKGGPKEATTVEMEPIMHQPPLRTTINQKSLDKQRLSQVANPEQLIQCTRL